MGVASRLLVVWAVDGSGPAGVLALTEGWVVDRRALLCGVVGLSGAWYRKHAHCCLPLSSLRGRGGLVGASVRAVVRVGVACCRGSGAVRPGCLTRLGLFSFVGFWVGVGGLVVNCIVDASILL